MTDNEKLIIMVEEMGEVARAMTYDEGSKAQFKKEVLQLAAMASATYMSMMESVVAEEVLDGP